jgi:hypothetical protein
MSPGAGVRVHGFVPGKIRLVCNISGAARPAHAIQIGVSAMTNCDASINESD